MNIPGTKFHIPHTGGNAQAAARADAPEHRPQPPRDSAPEAQSSGPTAVKPKSQDAGRPEVADVDAAKGSPSREARIETKVDKQGNRTTTVELRHNKEAEQRRVDKAGARPGPVAAARYENQVFIEQFANKVVIQVNNEVHELAQRDARNLVIRGSDGRDMIHVGRNADPFERRALRDAGAEGSVAMNLVVEGRGGNDLVMVNNSGPTVIKGGKGNDDLLTVGKGGAHIYGDKGRDYLHGMRGNTTLEGGDGDDSIYAGDGESTIVDAKGTNYLAAGAGKTHIETGGGHNVVAAVNGDADVTVRGGSATLYAGEKVPQIQNLLGARTTAYASEKSAALLALGGGSGTEVRSVDMSQRVGDAVMVMGTPEFEQRLGQDLEVMRSSPVGRAMLSAIDRSSDLRAGKGVLVGYADLDEGKGSSHTSDSALGNLVRKDGQHGVQSGAQVQIDPGNAWFDTGIKLPFPSVISLQHELAHAFNALTGTMQPGQYHQKFWQDLHNPDKGVDNLERQAVGLPNGGIPYDFDGDPATPKTTANPLELSESGLRDEMGLPRRENYSV